MQRWERRVIRIMADRCVRAKDDTRPVQPFAAIDELLALIREEFHPDETPVARVVDRKAAEVIRRAYEEGATVVGLANLFGIPDAEVRRIVRVERWRREGVLECDRAMESDEGKAGSV